MSVQGGDSAILTKALKDLMEDWEMTASRWRDEARSSFEKDILADLADAVRQASVAAKQIEDLLTQARRECS